MAAEKTVAVFVGFEPRLVLQLALAHVPGADRNVVLGRNAHERLAVTTEPDRHDVEMIGQYEGGRRILAADPLNPRAFLGPFAEHDDQGVAVAGQDPILGTAVI